MPCLLSITGEKNLLPEALQTIPLPRFISLVENGDKDSLDFIRKSFSKTGRAKVIGITGPPGAGKSTLVDSLCAEITSQQKKVAILAVDPTSPFSGGALLGDRIRMGRASGSEDVFLRSMASRGSLGGLAPQTREVILALDLYGFDYIIVETVGVGQAEIDIVKFVDTVMVVLVPGMGDTVQSLKAGVLEIGDIFVVNKADYLGADRLIAELKTLFSLAEDKKEWLPPIKPTVAVKDEGVKDVFEAVAAHRQYLQSEDASRLKRKKLLKEVLFSELHLLFQEGLEKLPDSQINEAVERFFKRDAHPKALAEELFRSYAKHYLVSPAANSV